MRNFAFFFVLCFSLPAMAQTFMANELIGTWTDDEVTVEDGFSVSSQTERTLKSDGSIVITTTMNMSILFVANTGKSVETGTWEYMDDKLIITINQRTISSSLNKTPKKENVKEKYVYFVNDINEEKMVLQTDEDQIIIWKKK